MMNAAQLKDKQTNEHRRKGIIDAEGPRGYKLPANAPGYGA